MFWGISCAYVRPYVVLVLDASDSRRTSPSRFAHKSSEQKRVGGFSHGRRRGRAGRSYGCLQLISSSRAVEFWYCNVIRTRAPGSDTQQQQHALMFVVSQ